MQVPGCRNRMGHKEQLNPKKRGSLGCSLGTAWVPSAAGTLTKQSQWKPGNKRDKESGVDLWKLKHLWCVTSSHTEHRWQTKERFQASLAWCACEFVEVPYEEYV